MKAQINLEYIGMNTIANIDSLDDELRRLGAAVDKRVTPSGPWVAEVYKMGVYVAFNYLNGKRDYTNSNSKRSRGVMVCYTIESNKLYAVYHKTSWRSSEKYFCAVTENGDIYKLTNEEALEWLNNM